MTGKPEQSTEAQDEWRALWGDAYTALGAYTNALPRGSGVHLFRAFVLHRKAAAVFAQSAGMMLEYEQRFWRDSIDKQRDAILAQLDAVLSDLDKVLAQEWEGEKDPTRVLPVALRLWKGTAPSDARARDDEARVREAMIKLYLVMQETKAYQTETALLNAVANETGLSLSTARRRWSAWVGQQPEVPEVRWIKEIVDRAKLAKHGQAWARTAKKYQQGLGAIRKKQAAQDIPAIPMAAPQKPRKREVTKPAHWSGGRLSKRGRNGST